MSNSNALNMRALTSGGALVPVTGSLDAYIRAVNAIPMLDAEEEREWARELRNHNDLQAAQRLILSNLRFVVHVARGYMGYGLPLADLIQEGNIGLMKASKRFDPDVGVRLISFAVHWIRAEIHEFILRNWRIVKVATTKSQRKLFFNLRRSKKRLGWLSAGEVRAVAEDLGVKPETVLQMERRLSGQDVSFNLTGTESDDEGRSPEEYLASEPADDPAMALEDSDWASHRRENLSQALSQLDNRSRDIVARRWLQEGKKTGLQALGDEYGVSAERIRQLEKAAITKLRKAMA
ncbi:MAG TPA: RNA polymerase sigma factor RpoH [Acidobacteriaceae bacterium]|nr:RNA polymerase sigma factor RpoH [Acidobacteriaceae bacterium]